MVLGLAPGPLVEREEPGVVVGAADPGPHDATQLLAARVSHGLELGN